MNTLSRIAAICLALIITTTIAGCGSNKTIDNPSNSTAPQEEQKLSQISASSFVAKYHDAFSDEEVIAVYNGALSVENESWQKDRGYDHSHDASLKELDIIMQSYASKYDEAVLEVTAEEVGAISSQLQKRASDIYLSELEKMQDSLSKE